MMQTESEIKRQLDGSFWFFDQYGNVQHRFVDVDFIPKNKPISIRSDRDQEPPIGSMRMNWPSNAYRLIAYMRKDKMTWQMIGQVFGASQNATMEYYKKKQRQDLKLRRKEL